MDMEWSASEELIAMAIGQAAMNCMDRQFLVEVVNSTAMEILEEIREVLNDDLLDDPECFYKIDAIISALSRRGIEISRHDFG